MFFYIVQIQELYDNRAQQINCFMCISSTLRYPADTGTGCDKFY